MTTRIDVPDLPALPDGAGLQKVLDDWLESHPDYQQYVSKVYFVPDGQLPDDATHTLIGTSVESRDQVTLAVVVNPPYAGLVDAALAALNRR